MRKVIFIFTLLIFTAGTVLRATAQDTLTKTDNSRIIVKVMEIGTDNVKYLVDGSEKVLPVSAIHKIVYADGGMDVFNPLADTRRAVLHIYRPASLKGVAISYNLNLDDETVFRAKNKSKTTVEVTGEGMKTLWAKTEKRIEFPIEIQPGQEYYIRCGVDMGAFVGRPSIEIVDSRTGKYEFDAIKSKTSDDDGRVLSDKVEDLDSNHRLVPANYHKGYAGVGVGPSLLLADYSDIDGTGLQFNVNFGYLFKQHIGVTASFLLTSYGTEYESISVGLRGGLVGPLISFQNSSLKVEYDIRPTVGIVSGKFNGNNASLKTDKMTFMLGVGGSVRWNVADFISLTGNLDTYFHGEFDEVESLASIGMTVGVNFRF